MYKFSFVLKKIFLIFKFLLINMHFKKNVEK